jgi:predicted ATPase
VTGGGRYFEHACTREGRQDGRVRRAEHLAAVQGDALEGRHERQRRGERQRRLRFVEAVETRPVESCVEDAETMHAFYTYLEDNPSSGPEPVFHEMSHGESFLAILDTRFDRPGLYHLLAPTPRWISSQSDSGDSLGRVECRA